MTDSPKWKTSAPLSGVEEKCPAARGLSHSRSRGHQGEQHRDHAQTDERREGAQAQRNHELDAEGRCALFGGTEPFTPHPGSLGIKNRRRRRTGQRGEPQGVAKGDISQRTAPRNSARRFPNRLRWPWRHHRSQRTAVLRRGCGRHQFQGPSDATSCIQHGGDQLQHHCRCRAVPAVPGRRGPDRTCAASSRRAVSSSSTPTLANSRFRDRRERPDKTMAASQRQTTAQSPQRTIMPGSVICPVMPGPQRRCRPPGPAAGPVPRGQISLACRDAAHSWRCRSGGGPHQPGRPNRPATVRTAPATSAATPRVCRAASPADPRPGRTPARVRAGEARSAT